MKIATELSPVRLACRRSNTPETSRRCGQTGEKGITTGGCRSAPAERLALAALPPALKLIRELKVDCAAVQSGGPLPCRLHGSPAPRRLGQYTRPLIGY